MNKNSINVNQEANDVYMLAQIGDFEREFKR